MCFRNVLRHRRTSLRLLILLFVFTLALGFVISFRDSFARQFHQSIRNLDLSDLQIVPKASPKLQADAFTQFNLDLILLDRPGEILEYLQTIPGISAVMPLLESNFGTFQLSGDDTNLGGDLVGVDMAVVPKLLPDLFPTEVLPMQSWRPGDTELELYIPAGYEEDLVQETGYLSEWSLKMYRDDWEQLKARAIAWWPGLFDATVDYRTEAGNAAFWTAIDQALDRDDLVDVARMPPDVPEPWQYADLDFAMRDLQNYPPQRISEINYRRILAQNWLHIQIPDLLWPQWLRASLHVPYTAVVPEAQSTSIIPKPVYLPVRTRGYLPHMSNYFWRNYLDRQGLASYLGLSAESATAIMVRLDDGTDAQASMATIQAWLDAQGLAAQVADYRQLGFMYLSTLVAIEVVTMIILLIFILTLILLLRSALVLSIKSRRREVGIQIVLGQEPGAVCGQLVIEYALIALAAVVLAMGGQALIVSFLAVSGLPGMFFFADDKLYFSHQAASYAIPAALVITTVLLTSILVSRGPSRRPLVEQLKEAE
jgi:ABC-type lipoprotein release transport system permease subunit